MSELPDDVEQLKAMLLKLQAENRALQKTIDTQAEEVVELENKMQLLLEQLNLSKSKRFSAKSEKEPKGTFNEAGQKNALSKLPPKYHKKGRKPLPAELEREVHQRSMPLTVSAVMKHCMSAVLKFQKS